MTSTFLPSRAAFALTLAALAAIALPAAGAPASPAELAQAYRTTVDRRLDVPEAEVRRYGRLADAAFAAAGVAPPAGRYLLVVDRSPVVQAAFLMWRAADGPYQLVGASPVSTGRPGEFDHFETPAGVFDHTPANPDFRAEGTFNENGIRGYGLKGLRVFDLGWQRVPKGWGDRAVIDMRLQMHATDPDALEQRLGTVQSKGCIRIPSSLNRLLDHHGVLDAEYEAAVRAGTTPLVLRPERDVVPQPGRYIVVVDSAAAERPDWSPAPYLPHRAPPRAVPVVPAPPGPPVQPPAVPIRR